MTGFSDCTKVNAQLICRVGNSNRIKAKFTIVNRPESSSFIASLRVVQYCQLDSSRIPLLSIGKPEV